MTVDVEITKSDVENVNVVPDVLKVISPLLNHLGSVVSQGVNQANCHDAENVYVWGRTDSLVVLVVFLISQENVRNVVHQCEDITQMNDRTKSVHVG